ncbi:hypothetical protein Syun_018277 [Stephania yunnanensis]|uniref:Non-haem dioxygenase N-terminal domain-containing protein n=1 Tax=Stephania yunnanensis TaxID=152371 RepID=A0AAP0IT12_9MAGN
MELEDKEYGSIPVPNVQYIATKELKEIPSRYIQPKSEIDRVSIDQGGESGDQMATFHKACKDWGFFQKIKGDTEEFFRLPLQEKKAYAQQAESFHGYGQAFVVSEEQKLDWSDVLVLRTLPIAERIKKNGTWVPVKPLPGAFIVNIGDAIEVSGDSCAKYKTVDYDEYVKSYFGTKIDLVKLGEI